MTASCGAYRFALTTARSKWAGWRRWRASSIANHGIVRPIWTSLRPIRKGPSTPIRMSAASSRKEPAAIAWPLQEAITGVGKERIRSASVAPRRSISTTRSPSPEAKTPRSKPAEKRPSRPASTSTASSRSAWSSSPWSVRSISTESAFALPSSIVTVAIRSFSA